MQLPVGCNLASSRDLWLSLLFYWVALWGTCSEMSWAGKSDDDVKFGKSVELRSCDMVPQSLTRLLLRLLGITRLW